MLIESVKKSLCVRVNGTLMGCCLLAKLLNLEVNFVSEFVSLNAGR